MKIVQLAEYHSEKMGYSDVCLPKKFSELGNEAHVVTSTGNIYFGSKIFSEIFSGFLGSPENPAGYKFVNGYHLHRLNYIRTPFGVYLKNLRKVLNQINPDIVQAGELTSLSTFQLALLSLFYKINFTVEVHIHRSVFTPSKKFNQIFKKVSFKNIIKYLLYKLKNFFYKLLIGPIISYALKRCYPISNDAAEIANKYLGIKEEKIEVRSLGTDCSIFFPNTKNIEINREKLGFKKNDFICIYTGRISKDKNCCLLKEAIQIINKKGYTDVKGLFVGSGNQNILNEIIESKNCKVIPFVHYQKLAEFYNLSNVGVWPAQESTSQLDILACAKPIIITDKSGTPDRAVYSGFLYKDNSSKDLAEKILKIKNSHDYNLMSEKALEKAQNHYNWEIIAKKYINDYSSFLKI